LVVSIPLSKRAESGLAVLKAEKAEQVRYQRREFGLTTDDEWEGYVEAVWAMQTLSQEGMLLLWFL
jgi:hypothetical protein